MATHVKVLGVLFIVLSALGVLAALAVGAIFGMAGFATATAGADDAAVALPFIGLTGGLLTAFLMIVSLPGLVAGFGLLAFKSWARILAVVLCALQLINFPFGTIVGIYGLWVLLNRDTERLFSTNDGPAITI